MRRALAEAALRAAAAASSRSSSSSSTSLRGAIVLSSSSSSAASASSDAAIFARASSSAAASSSASVTSAPEGEPKRSSNRSNKSGEKPTRQPRRRNDGTSSGGGSAGGGRTNRVRDSSAGYSDGFPGSSDSAISYDQYGDAVPPVVVNHAGQGAPGWQLLGEEPEISANFWALDAAGGRAGGAPEFAALLSSDAKDAMWAAYKGKGLSTSAIAKLFGVREQRAAAILALRAAEEEMDAESAGSNEEVALLFEGGVDGSGAVRAALDAAAARVELIERRRLEGIGQAPSAAAAAEGEGEGEEQEKAEEKSAGEALADEADAAVSAELSADAAAGAALRDASLPFSSSSSPSSSSSSKSNLAAGSVVEIVQGIWACDRLRGGGEKAVAPLPRYPAFELLLEQEGSGKKASKSSSRRKNRDSTYHLPHTDHGDEEAPAESEVPAAERARALEAEAEAVREFKARLAFSIGSPAAARAVLGVKESDDFASPIVAAPRSVSRAAVAPRRPEGGWSLLVKPLPSARGRPAREKPFVALPDGTRRPPSAEERAALRRATPLPRKRGVVS